MAETFYAWDPVFDCILDETDASGAVVAEYTQEPRLYGGLISQKRGGTTSYYHYDPIGTTRALTNQAQTVSDRTTYSAFGELVDSTGVTVNPFGFVGSLGFAAIQSADVIYIRRRMFAKQIGRWANPDPSPVHSRENLFVFCNNNPVAEVDPSGLISVRHFSNNFDKYERCNQRRNGESNIKWIFELNQRAPCDGYLIQHLEYACAPQFCHCSKPKRPTRDMVKWNDVYWEAFEVSKDETLYDGMLASKTKGKPYDYTDESGILELSGCGYIAMRGTIKFYCRENDPKKNPELGEPTGDLSKNLNWHLSLFVPVCAFEAASLASSVGQTPPGTYSYSSYSGGSLAIPSEPSFWADPGVKREGQATRLHIRVWSCCECAAIHDRSCGRPASGGAACA